MTLTDKNHFPAKYGLYDPQNEKDSCGVGFICNIKGIPSRDIVEEAKEMNKCMEHRGGVGYEKNTGDGAGILCGIPHGFFKSKLKSSHSITLPEIGKYGVGNVFLPTMKNDYEHCKRIIEKNIIDAGQELISWRELPISPESSDIGNAAKKAMPKFVQIFIKSLEINEDDFERKLYLIRKGSTHEIRKNQNINQKSYFYVCSLSSRVVVYKGMLTPKQLFEFYNDLEDKTFTSHLAMVHSRFSTNTFPSWDRAQPNRFMSHNGEINTLLGNKNWMNARQGVLKSSLFGNDLKKLFPIVEPDCSDSGTFDNVLEFLLMSGRTLQESILIMIPEAWQQDSSMNAEKRAFYEYNSCLMEPWDGPASIAFTDGKYIGAVLDRNGLRPSRYYLTKDDKCIMASEVGVVKVDSKNILSKGRLQPGKIFLIDFKKGKMIADSDIKSEWSESKPYKKWLNEQRVELKEFVDKEEIKYFSPNTILNRMRAFGYTSETLQIMLLPLVKELRDPLGSMGNDTSLAVMSSKPRMLYDYFKQTFAQVTNPAIDSIREEVIMSLECYIGPEKNLLKATSENANRLKITHPILSNSELDAIKKLKFKNWKSLTIDIVFPKNSGKKGLENSLRKICEEASQAIKDGYPLIILSDRKIDKKNVPISSLLALGTLHHFLVKNHTRTQVGLILETGEAREVHHHCLLIGYGADAINPYLAFEALWDAKLKGELSNISHIKNEIDLINSYKKGTGKGILKVMAKMGISTLQSYKGAQIFEAVGLSDEIISLAFTGTASRIEGIGLDVLAKEMQKRHEMGYSDREQNIYILPNPGDFHWRKHGEVHMWDPKSISDLQKAARNNDENAYWEFSKHANEETTRNAALRGLLNFKAKQNDKTLDINEVESEKEIVKRFATGAMSFGSISAEAHETLAISMNKIGGKSNTGEGGENPDRFNTLSNGESKRSAIKQVASGRFGVTIDYLTNADELQIKIIQGAKPGEGGELPGHKVDEIIAKLRYSTPGVGLISPPPHHDIYSIEDMAQLIHDLKNSNPNARISVKLGAEVGVGTVAAGVTKARADHIVIAGDSGGTGASPLTSIKHAGVPWELGIAETHQTLVMNNLRSRVVLQTDGQLKTGRDVAIAALLGAEEFGFSTAPLVALGCIMMRKCHLNTCPVGIATQDKSLRKKFTGHPDHVINYLFMVAKELRMIMASLGFKKLNEMIGRVDCLEINKDNHHWKIKGLDLSKILAPAKEPNDFLGHYAIHSQDHELEMALDNKLMKLSEPSINNGKKVYHEMEIVNTNRVVGGMLSNKIVREVGPKMLAEDTVHFKFNGSAGQSFGAWLAKGVTFEVEGDANDYVGKGLSGGKLIIYPPKNSTFNAEENIIIGNVVLYGATGGKCFFRGQAAERFCVRNSGAVAVVEGVGDHGCEYMTGGKVIILGNTGRNFAAGMSGGIAYIFDEDKDFSSKCNMEMVILEKLNIDNEIIELKEIIKQHADLTGSTVAIKLLNNWEQSISKFIKVLPIDYKRFLESEDKVGSAA
ncbi:MAG: glutamate synthase large subunit [Alphaproteobacteria bacterium TMED87]|nr:glutamate synthase large subunit [Rhodospirillaceae bacterium]OUV07739.1 MAG: glutamate synthase large subunit [Alphaproteobacteria bacterium TMED87]